MALSSPSVSVLYANAANAWTARQVAEQWSGRFFCAYASPNVDRTSTDWSQKRRWLDQFRAWQNRLGIGEAFPIMRWRHDIASPLGLEKLKDQLAWVPAGTFYARLKAMADAGGTFSRSANFEASLAKVGPYPSGKEPAYYGGGTLNGFVATDMIRDLADPTVIAAAVETAVACATDLGAGAIAVLSKRGQMEFVGNPAAVAHDLGYEIHQGSSFTDGVFQEPDWAPGTLDGAVEDFLVGVMNAAPDLALYLDELVPPGYNRGDGITRAALVDAVVPLTAISSTTFQPT